MSRSIAKQSGELLSEFHALVGEALARGPGV